MTGEETIASTDTMATIKSLIIYNYFSQSLYNFANHITKTVIISKIDGCGYWLQLGYQQN